MSTHITPIALATIVLVLAACAGIVVFYLMKWAVEAKRAAVKLLGAPAVRAFAAPHPTPAPRQNSPSSADTPAPSPAVVAGADAGALSSPKAMPSDLSPARGGAQPNDGGRVVAWVGG